MQEAVSASHRPVLRRLALAAFLWSVGSIKVLSGCPDGVLLSGVGMCAIAVTEILLGCGMITRWWRQSALCAWAIAWGGLVFVLVSKGSACGCLGKVALAQWQEGAMAALLGLMAAPLLASEELRQIADHDSWRGKLGD